MCRLRRRRERVEVELVERVGGRGEICRQPCWWWISWQLGKRLRVRGLRLACHLRHRSEWDTFAEKSIQAFVAEADGPPLFPHLL